MCGMTNTTGSGDKMEVIEWGNLMGDGKNEAMFTKDDDIASLTIQLSAALRREEVLREALKESNCYCSPNDDDLCHRCAALSACDEGRK